MIAVYLMYTAIFVPFKTSFMDEFILWIFYLDTFIDVCFFIDIILTFFSVYKDPTTH